VAEPDALTPARVRPQRAEDCDMTHRIVKASLACVALTTCLLAPSPANELPASRPASTRPAPADKQAFIRFSDDRKGGGTLDTAIATYRDAAGVEVHLVAALHVGEASYYKGLSRTFDTYDALLYELVKPKGGAVPGERGAVRDEGGTRIRGAGAIGGIQSLMKRALELEFQLDAINYDRPNFVHADLDAETFNAMQDEKGESMFGLMLRSMVHEMKRQHAGKGAPAITSFDLLAAMASPDSARQYKLLLARQFGDIEEQIAGLEGKDGSVLIAERNKAALRVLKQRIAWGERSIGVFYGAGHMPGIEKVLVGEMGFKPVGVEWRIAWDMREAPRGATTKPAGPRVAK
jgi:hypothetical protein